MRDAMTRPTCGTCRWWDVPSPAYRVIANPCRRFPLLVLKNAADWCGEHTPTARAAGTEDDCE